MIFLGGLIKKIQTHQGMEKMKKIQIVVGCIFILFGIATTVNASLITETFDTESDTLITFSLDTLSGDSVTHWYNNSGNGELWINGWGSTNSIKFNNGIFEVVSFDIRLISDTQAPQDILFYDQSLNVIQTSTLAQMTNAAYQTVLVGIHNVSVIQFDHFGANYAIDNVTYETTPVPEPATMLLFGTGLVGLASSRLRKKKK